MYPIAAMRRVLEVSASGYSAWLKRVPPARADRDRELTGHLERIHERFDRTHGVPRVYAELKEEGDRVARKRIARLMKGAGLAGVSRRSKTFTTVRDAGRRPARRIRWTGSSLRTGPTRLGWRTSRTSRRGPDSRISRLCEGVRSRRIVGWAMANHLRTELVLHALHMAVAQRRPGRGVHHSDQRSRYTSIGFGQRRAEAGVRPSMGSVGDCYARREVREFLRGRPECELLARHRYRTPAEGRMSVFRFIEGWYHPHRRHLAPGQIPPVNFEKKHRGEAAA